MLSFGVSECRERTEESEEAEIESASSRWFLMHDSEHVFRTDAGEMRIMRTFADKYLGRFLHIGFISMEPKTLLIPQYMDSSLTIFIRRGEATVGLIYKDELGERRLKSGDVYRIPAGSVFYIVNTGEGQRLHIICSIDPSESLRVGNFQSFFVGGGADPRSILSGFGRDILCNALNVSEAELSPILTSQRGGPVVYVRNASAPAVWTKFLQLGESERLQKLKRMAASDAEDSQTTWSFRKFLNSVLGKEGKKGAGKTPDSYNIYDRTPDFRNDYGWSVALYESDYSPLEPAGTGVYYVNLSAGSMMAPHVNPRATEYGVVLRGSGRIQIVYPNGTSAMDAQVSEGDVFWIPRYFPFCQIASRTGPFEFFGFTTSARKNRPQFLVGANSLLRTMRGPVLAAGFDVDEDTMDRLNGAQREAVILPTAMAAPPDRMDKKRSGSERLVDEMKNIAERI